MLTITKHTEVVATDRFTLTISEYGQYSVVRNDDGKTIRFVGGDNYEVESDREAIIANLDGWAETLTDWA